MPRVYMEPEIFFQKPFLKIFFLERRMGLKKSKLGSKLHASGEGRLNWPV